MDTQIVKEFLVLAQDMSYSTASKKLSITEAKLRKDIEQLENVLGVSLVRCVDGEDRLTTFGELFLKDGEELVSSVEEVVSSYRNK